MKKLITLSLALFAVLSVNAQREYRDGVYYIKEVSGNRIKVSKRERPKFYLEDNRVFSNGVNYDDVIENNSTIKNVLVKDCETINYFHVNEVKENHYYINGDCRGYNYLPRSDCRASYDGYNQLPQNDEKWFFYFHINSDYLINKEELGHLINYAKENPTAEFYIDSYADAATGSSQINLELSKRRSNSIVNILLAEGINRNRIFVKYHGSYEQVYNTNYLNRCVTIKALK